MDDVAVERGEVLFVLGGAEQIGAHRHQFAGAAGRPVQPADQFLPPRLGGEMQIAGVVVARLRAPGLDGMGQLLAVRAVIARQGVEEGERGRPDRGGDTDRAPRAPSRCRRLRPGRTAAPRRVRSARRRPVWRRRDFRAAAGCGPARKSWKAGRRKRRWPWGGSNPKGRCRTLTPDLGQSRAHSSAADYRWLPSASQ